MTVSVLWFFLTVPWVGLQRMIVVFPDHTHFLYSFKCVELWADNLDMFCIIVHISYRRRIKLDMVSIIANMSITMGRQTFYCGQINLDMIGIIVNV